MWGSNPPHQRGYSVRLDWVALDLLQPYTYHDRPFNIPRAENEGRGNRNHKTSQIYVMQLHQYNHTLVRVYLYPA